MAPVNGREVHRSRRGSYLQEVAIRPRPKRRLSRLPPLHTLTTPQVASPNHCIPKPLHADGV